MTLKQSTYLCLIGVGANQVHIYVLYGVGANQYMLYYYNCLKRTKVSECVIVVLMPQEQLFLAIS
jgi:hypothetical protein